MATEIGLTAKVDPELNDKKADEEAGRLSEKMQESISDLEAQMDIQEVSQRAQDAQDSAQEATGGGGEENPYGGGYSGLLVQKLDGVLAANLKQVAFIKSLSGALSNFGNTLLEKGGKFALIGGGLVALGRIYDAASQNSALLGSVLGIFSQAMGLFFRPIGRKLGKWLLPIAIGMLELAANFNSVFGSRGFFASLVWLAGAIIEGLTPSMGGKEGQGGMLGARIRQLEFGVVLTTLSTALAKKAASMSVGRIFGFILGIPGLGTFLKKKFGESILNMSLGQVFKTGISKIFQRLGIPAISPILKSLFSKAIGKLGLSFLFKGLAGKLTYAIPIVGQAIAIIDLLVFAITALIPGMEAFSPVTWALVGAFNILKAGALMLWDALKGFGSWAKGLLGMGGGEGDGGGLSVGKLKVALDRIYDVLKVPMLFLMPFAVLGIELFGILKGVSWQDITSFLGDIKDRIQNFAGGLLTDAKSIWEFVEDESKDIWQFVTETSKDIWEFVTESSKDVWTFITENSKDLWSFINERNKDLWGFINERNKDLWGFINERNKDLWGFINQRNKDLWGFINERNKDFWGFVNEVNKDLWGFINETNKDLWGFINETNKDLWGFINEQNKDLWSFINTVTNDLWDYIDTTTNDLWDYIDTEVNDLWDYIDTTTNDLWDYIDTTVKDIWDYIDTTTKDVWGDFIDWSNDAAKDVWGDIINWSTKDLWGDIIDAAGDVVGSAKGRVATQPMVSAVAESEPEVIVPFSKIGGFVRNILAGKGPRNAIPGLAEGGLVTSPTMAMIGEGGESEAVLPLSRLDSMMSTPDTNAPSPSIDASASVDVGGEATQDDIVAELDQQIGSKLDDVRADLQELASQISKLDVGEVKVTADGKVLAEITQDGEDTYRRQMEVNR